MAGFLLLCFRTLHRIGSMIRRKRLTLRASAKARCSNAFGVSPSPGTTIQKTQPMAGFLLLCFRTLHRIGSMIRRKRLTLRASAKARCSNAFGVSPSPGTTIQKTQPMAGFLLLCFRTLYRIGSMIRLTTNSPPSEELLQSPEADIASVAISQLNIINKIHWVSNGSGNMSLQSRYQ